MPQCKAPQSICDVKRLDFRKIKKKNLSNGGMQTISLATSWRLKLPWHPRKSLIFQAQAWPCCRFYCRLARDSDGRELRSLVEGEYFYPKVVARTGMVNEKIWRVSLEVIQGKNIVKITLTIPLVWLGQTWPCGVLCPGQDDRQLTVGIT